MDLFFQGLAWLNKGSTPDNVTQARSFFDRALAADPGNVGALVGSAGADVVEGAFSFVTDPMAAFAAAEAKLTKALSSVPDHARGHMLLGLVDIFDQARCRGHRRMRARAGAGSKYRQRPFFIGIGKVLIGRAEETEAHIGEALRLSPRDTTAYTWMLNAGWAKLHLGSYEQAVAWCRRAIEANRNYPPAHFNLPPPWRSLAALTRRIPLSKPASRSTRPTPSPAAEPPGRHRATTRRIWLGSNPFSTAYARRGCRRNEASLKALRERVRCSSLVDWPVYPRLRRTMQASTNSRNKPMLQGLRRSGQGKRRRFPVRRSPGL